MPDLRSPKGSVDPAGDSDGTLNTFYAANPNYRGHKTLVQAADVEGCELDPTHGHVRLDPTHGRPSPVKPLTRVKLDALPCACCGDPAHNAQPMFLHPACHPGRGVNVEFVDGVLTICCKACDKFVVSLETVEGSDNAQRTIRSLCHPSRGLNVDYFAGLATVRCKVCETPVVKFQIVDGEDAPSSLLN